MEKDSYMEQVEEDEPKTPNSPPRKKPKIQFTSIPKTLMHKIEAQNAQCNSLIFLNNSNYLVTGGKHNSTDPYTDNYIKIWDASTGAFVHGLDGFKGSVCDLAVDSHNKILAAGLSTHRISVWDLNSTRIHRTLIGHQQKICAVDVSKSTGRFVIGAATNDHVLKAWDLSQDTETGISYPWISSYIPSTCNALRFTNDETIFCSGHSNGAVRFTKIDRFFTAEIGEVTAVHTQSVTSICALEDGNAVLSSGRDNVHNVIDVRAMKVCGKFRTRCNKVATNWTRTCVSPNGEFAAVGSAEGPVYVWSIKTGKMVTALKQHGAPVVCCGWSGTGGTLASCDSDGNICIWS